MSLLDHIQIHEGNVPLPKAPARKKREEPTPFATRAEMDAALAGLRVDNSGDEIVMVGLSEFTYERLVLTAEAALQ